MCIFVYVEVNTTYTTKKAKAVKYIPNTEELIQGYIKKLLVIWIEFVPTLTNSGIITELITNINFINVILKVMIYLVRIINLHYKKFRKGLGALYVILTTETNLKNNIRVINKYNLR